jgi:hypothetical protein
VRSRGGEPEVGGANRWRWGRPVGDQKREEGKVELDRVVRWTKLGHTGEIGWRPGEGKKERREEERWAGGSLGRAVGERISWAGCDACTG